MKNNSHPLWRNADNFAKLHKKKAELRMPSLWLKHKIAFLATSILIGTSTPAWSQESTSSNLSLYEWYLNDYWYEIVDREWFYDFLSVFSPILDSLHEIWVLTGYDINDAMNLYVSWLNREENIDEYLRNYLYFAESFPNPEIAVQDLLSGIWIVSPIPQEIW